MRSNSKSRLGRAAVALAVGTAAVVGVASAASAQNWNGYYNGGYYQPYYTNAPYNSANSNRGWTWGERYGTPPAGTYYSGNPYYSGQGHYAPQQSYPQAYGSNPQAVLGQIMGLFGR